MLRFAAFSSLVAGAVVLVAACGGAVEPSSFDGGARTSSSSSSSSSSSGSYPRFDSGRVVGPRDASFPPSPPLSPGLVRCPSAQATCATETAGLVFTCCVRKGEYSCETGTGACLDGDQLNCDEAADCKSGACCAEGGRLDPTTYNYGVTTFCRPSCITNVPRVLVCNVDSDCATGTCREWKCGGFDTRGLKTCAPLGPCD